MNKILIAYINFFRNKDFEGCKFTNNFIKDYQQTKNKSGYGYINLAHYIETRGKTTVTLRTDIKEYYKYLVESENISELENLIGMSKSEILNVSVDSSTGKPNQKWHLLVSYLGMKWFQGSKVYIHMVSCPELWIWMFEVSELFTDDEMKIIYKTATKYKTNEIALNEWRNFLKQYREKLHKKIMYQNDELI